MALIRTVSWSEIDTARQCPFRHDLAYKQRWVSPEPAPALQRGTLWHTLLEGHYRILREAQQRLGPDVTRWTDEGQGETKRALLVAAKTLLYDPRSGEQTETQGIVDWMYTGYLEHWGLDPGWRIVAVEHAPVVWLPTDRGTRSNYKLKLKIDLIVRDEMGRLWLVDHKSGRDLPSDKELALDDQFGLYTWAMRRLGRKVHGSIHSAAKTYRNKTKAQTLPDRFRRTLLHRNDAELDTLAVEAWRDAKMVYSYQDGQAPRHTNPDTCRWRCSFTEACLAGRRGGGVTTESFLARQGFEQQRERH